MKRQQYILTVAFMKVIFLLCYSNLTAQPVSNLKNKLVFTRGEPAAGLIPSTESVWIMNADGKEQRRVWRVPKGYGQFGGFSPNGKYALSYNSFNLYLHNLSSRRFRRIFFHNGGRGSYIASASWSRSGQYIIFEAGGMPGGEYYARTYIVDMRKLPRNMSENELDKRQVPLPKGVYDMFEPHLSGDGKRIVFSHGMRHAIWPPTIFSGPWEISITNLNGTNLQAITRHPEPLEKLNNYDMEPCFSRSNRKIAFVRRYFLRGLGEVSDLWLVDEKGKHERRLTPFLPLAAKADKRAFKETGFNRVDTPCFSADDQMIVFNQSLRADTSANGIYRIDSDGRNLKRILDGKLVQWIN